MTSPHASPNPSSLFRQLAEQALARSAGAPLVAGNQIEVLFDAEANFQAWWDSIATAQHSVLIEMYLFADDEFGQQLRGLLLERLAQGVQVYVLYDWLGCWREHYRGFFKPLQQAAPRFAPGKRLAGPAA